MNRKSFLIKIIRYFLLLLTAALIAALGNRVVTGNVCSRCPGNGICTGESDCNKY